MNDAEYIKSRMIRWLLDGALGFDASKDAIGTEVPFCAHRRRAALLVLSEEFHSFEIKGDLDNLSGLPGQLADYRTTFDKVTVVCAPKHLPALYTFLQRSTGVIVLDEDGFRVKRVAARRRRLDKRSLLTLLDKAQLCRLLYARDNRCLSTTELRIRIAGKLGIREIRWASYSHLRQRYGRLFSLFLNDLTDAIPVDELRGLSGKVSKLHA